ncbi:hypothetical protein HII31_01158 [Pseudocercospora fuligena]|uniref:VOC domain-containing protein n=1 Tax=Pseudocercospora fuligena TaxID=685502 RepID=A0A8H6RUV9_9PEZI|nr:hypothetical protein HII31_01158 [Pseudocercospora fuligena]
MSTSSQPPLKITHILETCIYCTSLSASKDFYSNTLGLTPDFSTDRMCVYPLGSTTLLLFQLGKTGEDIIMNNTDDKPERERLVVPRHGPTEDLIPGLLERKEGGGLRQHFCLAVKDKDEAMEWEKYFNEKDVKVIGRMEWQRGGYSVYFEDPDGHCGEIASRGIWGHY